MKLIITRHGETIENINRICQGQIGGTLSKKGIAQTKKLALRLKNMKIDEIYSSDLKRAVDTSKEILKFHSNLKLRLDKRLRERFLGKYQGKIMPKDFDWENTSEKIEKIENIYERVKEFLFAVYNKHKNKTVLVVSHGGIIMTLLNIIYNTPNFKLFDVKNTSILEVEITGKDKYKINTLNCTKHLE